MVSLARRPGAGKEGLVEGRTGVGRDFMVSCSWVGGFGVFGVHDCVSGCLAAWLQSSLESECSNRSNPPSLLYAV